MKTDLIEYVKKHLQYSDTPHDTCLHCRRGGKLRIARPVVLASKIARHLDLNGASMHHLLTEIIESVSIVGVLDEDAEHIATDIYRDIYNHLPRLR